MPEIEIVICDVGGVERARPPQYEGVEVEIPHNDSRLAKVTLPMWDVYSENDTGVQHILPFKRRLKIRYDNRLVFHGPIVEPKWDFTNGTVTVHAHDPTIYLKNHFLEDWDDAVTTNHDANGSAAWEIVKAARLRFEELTAGYRQPGIVEGPDNTTAVARQRKSKVGVNVWDDLIQFCGSALGPDFSFVPIDEEYDPDLVYSAGAMVMMERWNEQGSDKRDSVIFQFGFGADSLESFNYDPAGAAMRNRFTAVINPDSGPGFRHTAILPASLADHGIMEGREVPNSRKETDVAKLYAEAQVKAYGLPPNFITMVPRAEFGKQGSVAGTPFRYGESYDVGDVITAQAKRGRMEVDVPARVEKVTLTQVDQSENVKVSLQVAPDNVDEADVVQEGGGGGGEV